MKNLITFALAVIVFTACQESLEDKATREAEMYTKKNCPSQMTENIRLDSMTFERVSHTLHYYYTLTGVADSAGVIAHEEVKSALLHELRNTTGLKAYKDAGYQFSYTYRSEKEPSTVLYNVVLGPKDYE